MLSFDQYLSGLNRALSSIDSGAVEAAVQEIVRVHAEDRVVYTCGNGGSASTASHMVNDLVKAPADAASCRPIRAIGLTDSTSLMTAFANDIEYAQMFSKQLEAYGREGDLLITISGSGNSPNVLEAAKVARKIDMKVIAMTGFQGGKLKDLADIHINVANTSFGQIEDAHLIVQHAIVEMLKEAFGGKTAAEI